MEAASAAVTLSSTVKVSKEKVNDYISIKKEKKLCEFIQHRHTRR